MAITNHHFLLLLGAHAGERITFVHL